MRGGCSPGQRGLIWVPCCTHGPWSCHPLLCPNSTDSSVFHRKQKVPTGEQRCVRLFDLEPLTTNMKLWFWLVRNRVGIHLVCWEELFYYFNRKSDNCPLETPLQLHSYTLATNQKLLDFKTTTSKPFLVSLFFIILSHVVSGLPGPQFSTGLAYFHNESFLFQWWKMDRGCLPACLIFDYFKSRWGRVARSSVFFFLQVWPNFLASC